MVQHVDLHSIRVGFVEIPANDLHLKWKIDVRTVFERNLHDALARDLDDLYPSDPIFQLLQANDLRDFSFAMDRNDQRRQLINLYLKHAVNVSWHF